MATAAAIVPAAGRGLRMGEGPAKQYRLLGGRPILWHTLARLQASPRIRRIIAAIHGDDEERFGCISSDPLLDKLQAPVLGGSTRSESVRAGLEALGGEELVLVHDAVRPWVSTDLIERIAAVAEEHGAAVPVLPVTETIKVVDGGRVLESPDRSRLFRAQTPRVSAAPCWMRPFDPPRRGRSRRTKPPCWSGRGSRCTWCEEKRRT